MASIALRCLAKARPTPARLAPALLPTTLSAAPFSTAPALLATASSKGKHIIKGKGKKNYKKKPSQAAKARTPAPGERKAFRKRIQLSNNNAIAVGGLATLSGESMASEDARGRVLGIPDRLVDQLRTVEAFRPGQSWGLFRRPHVLVRSETVELAKMMDAAKEGKKTMRMVLNGGRVTGKSTMLLSAMAHAFLNDWIVVHIPEAFQLTNAHTDYAPVADTEPPLFSQPAYSLKLLQSILKANNALLSTLPLKGDYSKVAHLAQLGHEPTLADLAGSCREMDHAWPTLSALWSELTTEGRPPVLFTLDGLPFVMRDSAYRDTAFNPVHAHQLTTVRLFTEAMAGKTKFPNGAAILGTTGGNDNVKLPSLDLVLSQLDAGAKGLPVPKPDPYQRGYDDRVFDALKDAQLLNVGGVTKEEARAVMEYWAASGMLLDAVTEPSVSTRWTLGGHGVMGEMEKVAFRNMRC